MSDQSSGDCPKNAHVLLVQAKQESSRTGELVKLILGGTREVDSWLIENRILPALARRGIGVLRFSQASSGHQPRSAALVPLPDGSAFACNAAGRWSALDGREARHEIQYIGFRHAPSKHWHHGFRATLQRPDGQSVALTPSEVAKTWEEITGYRPLGFKEGLLDHIHAFGFNMMDKAFHTQGQLGL